MAGDPLGDPQGGFVILGGIRFNERGLPEELDTPFPGANLFSLASGGAVYLRDPNSMVGADQLHGGTFTVFSDKDLQVIKPYLEENARLFGARLEGDLLVDEQNDSDRSSHNGAFRKIVPATGALH
jgi:hypothetical protein